MAGRCLLSPQVMSVCPSICLLALAGAQPPGAGAGGVPWGGRSTPAALLAPPARRSPGGRPEGRARGTQSPSVPAHKGMLVACSLPRPRCASRAPARKSFRTLSSPSRPRRVTPCVPQPHGSALQGPPCLSPRLPCGFRAGRLQPAVYLTNYVCPGPVKQGFCQRCWKWLSVSSL